MRRQVDTSTARPHPTEQELSITFAEKRAERRRVRKKERIACLRQYYEPASESKIWIFKLVIVGESWMNSEESLYNRENHIFNLKFLIIDLDN